MPEPMKDQYYNPRSLHELASRVKGAYPSFPVASFLSGVMDGTWDALGLKARMRRITVALGSYLPADYAKALAVLDQVLAGYPPGYHDNAFLYFPDFVEVYGQAPGHWDLSMAALERYTAYATSEFAVRPFLLNHEARMLRQMAAWAGHENSHVRRLASEGCRPRLPWGQALPSLIKDPTPILGILERLKADPSPYVRKSVANNLNDISKTHPGLVLATAKAWYGACACTDWVVKHGCRTLLKNGNQEALGLLGFSDAGCVVAEGFALGAKSVPIEGDLAFSFRVTASRPARVRLEYSIDYVKANGKTSRKVFQISEISLKANQAKAYVKTHSFADSSTRAHHPGAHSITLHVNGVARGALGFSVLPAN